MTIFAQKEMQNDNSPLLFTFGNSICNDFLREEIDITHDIGDTIRVSELKYMWSNPIIIRALLKHPSALYDLRFVAKKQNIRIESVRVKDVLNLLEVTEDCLWDANVETIEDLLIEFPDIHDDIVRHDIASAFLSIYGINLLELHPHTKKTAS